MYEMLLAVLLAQAAPAAGEGAPAQPAEGAPAQPAGGGGVSQDGMKNMGPAPEDLQDVNIPEGEHNIGALAKFVVAVAQGSPASQKEKADLVAHLMALPKTTKPDESVVTQFVSDLSGAKAGGKIEAEASFKLAAAIAPILDTASLPKKDLEGMFQAAKATFEEVGFGAEKVRTLMTDLRAISKNIQGK